ncbi:MULTISPECIES: hypothetical protein [Paenibacillus]|uniref:Uncharacterized protein n=1 Tax=Paenibacillus odorifer TaxID=189426 RepID=A0A1R0X2A1_9BACL|nr:MULTISPECIES: hypothetical protein [Paenibacillus]AIQ75900.1 hypothetical protein PODO_23105 [Paenibacillus odorifer]ETT56994.1 hypothetical protein C171_17836 [Paenibacillus sp. FSL H8-237]MEC0131269.1 DUF3139 domain-containing protein [Paenibacillus odorifer]MEC0222092.1 DUF3139 domain-containing protein [Paenibacillus odorifer]OMD17595.1 hypothetical protein BJP50_15865 [Paenibacillus odorifer]
MKKNTKLIFIVLILLICGITSLALHSFRNHMNREVIHYLIETRNYKKEDFYKVYTQIAKAPLVSTTVIFADEPYARYFYRKENGRIYQYSRAPVKGNDPSYTYKHIEEDLQ